MQTTKDKTSRTLEWAPKMRTRGGKIGHYRGVCDITGKRRLVTSNKYAEYNPEYKDDTYTTWLLDDAGFARGDHAPCAEDAIGAA